MMMAGRRKAETTSLHLDEFESILPSAPALRPPLEGHVFEAPLEGQVFEAQLEEILPTGKEKPSVTIQAPPSEGEGSSSEEEDVEAGASGVLGDIDGSPWPGTPFRVRQERARVAGSGEAGSATIGTGDETTLLLYWLRSMAPWWRRAVADFLESAGPREDEGYRHTVIIIGFPLAVLVGSTVIIAAAGRSASDAMGAVAAGAWIGVATIAVCGVVCLISEKREMWHPFWTVFLAWFICAAGLLVFPAAMIVTGSTSTALVGALLFLLEVWLLGWAFLWYRAPSLVWVAERQHLVSIPSVGSIGLKFKPLIVAVECFNYAGCSFVPAVPWQAATGALGLPSLSAIMLAGFFEQAVADSAGDSMAGVSSGLMHWTFLVALLVVPVSFVMFFLTRSDKRQNLMVILVCFDLLTFPVLKRLTSVLACTSDSIWVFTASPRGIASWYTEASYASVDEEQCCDGSLGNHTSAEMGLGTAARSFCQLDTELQAVGERYCMNNDPSTECWEQTHLQYLLISACLLVPYYFATLELQALVQAQQSVVVVDGSWTYITTQSKFFLATVASVFGDCYPIVMVSCVAAVMLLQLLLVDVTYSSVLTINSVRVGGLLCGLFSTGAAGFVLVHIGYLPETSTCSTLTDLQTAVAAAAATTTGTDGTATAATATADQGQQKLQADWLPFIVVMSLNFLAILLGAVWHICKRSTWSQTDKNYSWSSINGEVAFETDYPILASRLRSLQKLVSAEIDRRRDRSDSGPKQERSRDDADTKAIKRLALEYGMYNPHRTLEGQEATSKSIGNDQRAGLAARRVPPGRGRLRHLGVTTASGNGWLLDVYLREENGQQLERTTLEMVLSSDLLSFPLGLNLRDMDVTAPSGIMALRYLGRYGTNSRLGAVSKSFPPGRIASIQVTNLGQADTALKFAANFRTLAAMGLTDLDLSGNRLGDDVISRTLDSIKFADVELVSLDISACNLGERSLHSLKQFFARDEEESFRWRIALSLRTVNVLGNIMTTSSNWSDLRVLFDRNVNLSSVCGLVPGIGFADLSLSDGTSGDLPMVEYEMSRQRYGMTVTEINLSGNIMVSTVPILEALGQMIKQHGVEKVDLSGCNIDAVKAIAFVESLTPGFSVKIRELEDQLAAAQDYLHRCSEDVKDSEAAYASALDYVQALPGSQVEELQARLAVAATQLDDVKATIETKKTAEARGEVILEPEVVDELHSQLREATTRQTELQDELAIERELLDSEQGNFCRLLLSLAGESLYKLRSRKPGSLREGSIKYESLQAAERKAQEFHAQCEQTETESKETIEQTQSALKAWEDEMQLDVKAHLATRVESTGAFRPVSQDEKWSWTRAALSDLDRALRIEAPDRYHDLTLPGVEAEDIAAVLKADNASVDSSWPTEGWYAAAALVYGEWKRPGSYEPLHSMTEAVRQTRMEASRYLDANCNFWDMTVILLKGDQASELELKEHGARNALRRAEQRLRAERIDMDSHRVEKWALRSISLDANPIGRDGARTVIEMFEQHTRLRTVLGIEECTEILDLRETGLIDRGHVMLIVAELKMQRAARNVKTILYQRGTGSMVGISTTVKLVAVLQAALDKIKEDTGRRIVALSA